MSWILFQLLWPTIVSSRDVKPSILKCRQARMVAPPSPLMWLHGVELIGCPPNPETITEYCLVMRLENTGLGDCEGTEDSVFGS